MSSSPQTLILGAMPRDAAPATHLAAGPWCFCGQERHFTDWERAFTFAPEPLADASLAPMAARAAQTLAAKSIPAVAALLSPNADALPPQYWQILLAPWIIDTASQIVERAYRVKAILDQWGKKPLLVPLLDECVFNFADEHDFTLRGSLGALFNHWLFSRLLRAQWPRTWQAAPLPPQALAPYAAPPATLAQKLRAKAAAAALRLDFPRLKGMTLAEAARFSLALAMPVSGRDHSLQFDEAFSYKSDLEAAPLPQGLDLIAIFAAALPMSLRGLRHDPAIKAAKRPRLRIAALKFHEDASYRQRLARWRAAGNRLGFCQHGGNYGQVRWPCAAEFVEYSQDIFFTWGWSSQGSAKGNFVPLPSPQLSRIRNAWQGKNGKDIVFAGTEMAAYGHRLDSHPTPLQFVRYRADKAAFFSALTPELRRICLYRPYFSLPGTLADADWLLPQFPELRLCDGALLPRMLQCRLLVLDHHGTCLLEALAANVPTLLYWDRAAWPLAPECDILLDLLENCGVWHSGPKACARKLMEIWPHVEEWWNTPEIRMARDFCCRRQARASAEPAKIWLKTLKKL